MEMVWKIVAGVVLLPFLLWGLSMLIQFMGIAGWGIFTSFVAVWDKDTKLTFKHGLGIGLGYVVLSLLISGVFWWFLGMHETARSEVHSLVKKAYDLLGLGLLIVALIRTKFKFALGYFCSAIGVTLFLQLLVLRFY